MEEIQKKYYPTILQAIHLLILYLFIQALVDFPLAVIDYYYGTDYLYNPAKKTILGAGSTIFILLYGFRRSKAPVKNVFPLKFFNPLIILFLITYFWGIQALLQEVNTFVDKAIPAPPWFWELFNKIFESDYGWWGTFAKVVVIAPVIEELIFRGIILQGFRRNYSNFTAIVISALLFSLYHLNPWQMPSAFVLGLMLGWLMIRSRSILLTILGHSINNLLVLVTISWWEEIRSLPLYQLEKKEMLLLGGGLVIVSVTSIHFLSLRKNKKS